MSLTQATSIVIMVANLPPVSTTLAKLVAKFATNVVSGAGGKLIHEKTRSKKSRDTVPLKVVFVRFEKIF